MTPPTVQFIPAAGGGTFIPTDIGGCISWFDADDSSTITISTGVSNWADKSGNTASSPYDTGDFYQLAASSQPVVTSAGLNGRDVITFDGTDDFLLGRLPSSVTSASLFIVSNPDSDTNWLHINRSATNYSAVVQSGSSSTVLTSGFGTPTHYITGNTTSWTTRNDIYVDMGASTEIYEAVGCNLTAFSDSSGTSSYRLVGYGSGFNMAGDIAEVIVYNTTLSASDREKVEGYLAHKWGLTARLPPLHPYKTVAP